LEAGTFRFRDPLNKERLFIPLRLDATPIKGSLAQFLYINWRPMGWCLRPSGPAEGSDVQKTRCGATARGQRS
jgi:hypothetical protein